MVSVLRYPADSLDPSGYTNVDDYLDALTATARSQRKDRYFTYLTSIQQENAYYSQGSSAGFGWRLGLDSTGRLYVTEAYESAPALNAGIDRGAEILAIGTSSSNLQTVSSLYNAGGSALSDSLGPSTTGTQRYFQIRDASGTRTVAVTKTDFTLSPVSNRYGVKIITDNGQRYGYVNLRTFITTANDQLRSAFAQFKAAGITNVVVDLRYNGGGLIDTAVVMSNLLGGNRATTDVMSYMTSVRKRRRRTRPICSSPSRTRSRRPRSPLSARVARIGERVRHQCLRPLSGRQRRADRRQYLWQAGGSDRAGPEVLRRPAARDRLRVAECGAAGGLL